MDKTATPRHERDVEEVPRPKYRLTERFWPYVELKDEPDEEELVSIDPDLRTALFGDPDLAFSITLVFPAFKGEEYIRAVSIARGAAEYREMGTGQMLRHRARYFPSDVIKLRELFSIVGQFDECDVLVDDRPVPYARELWLPLMWFLISR